MTWLKTPKNMKKQWKIREALVDDAVGLQACMQSAYASYQDRMGGKRLPPMHLDYAIEITDFPTWVAELDGIIVGGLTMMFEKDFTTIANIAVHSEFQGQGLGGGLMKFAESQAKEKGYSEMRLATHVLLSENVTLYLYFGWTEFDRDDNKVYMKKSIVD
jgi:GNAT superfamily N-acetyltransferase